MDQGAATTDSPAFTALTVNGTVTVTGTVDGRDVATDGNKLDGIEAGADVTDTANVTAAGALMLTGGTMTGNLILNADPTSALQAATKQYVDTLAGDQTPQEILDALKVVDGSGSGLDADLLDGQHGNYYYSPTNAPNPTLTIDGDASGNATFTNLGNATLTLTIADDSHNHVISNLDGYEEGTFTPTVITESGTPSYNYRSGKYIKVGNLVTCGGIIGVTNSSSLTGIISVVLPFAPSAPAFGLCMGSASDGSGFNWPIRGFYSLNLQSSANGFSVVGVGPGGSGIFYNDSGVSNFWFFRYGVTYFTA